ncbi:MAG: sensor histidine kinase, partial [Calditrichia bacterium]|nr:sensor histidine kinase [Calditrichia bacterium]
NYLSIEKLRLQDKLSYNFEIEDSLYSQKIPPLLIEPLVENAVIHGIAKKREGGTVNVQISKNEGKIRIIISDTGKGMENDTELNGFGLYSAQNRIKLLYGNKASLNIKSVLGEGTAVTMEIPHEN